METLHIQFNQSILYICTDIYMYIGKCLYIEVNFMSQFCRTDIEASGYMEYT